jgi:hypothetical protein
MAAAKPRTARIPGIVARAFATLFIEGTYSPASPAPPLQLVLSSQSPAESVGHVPSSHRHTEQNVQLLPLSQSPIESIAQLPSVHVQTEHWQAVPSLQSIVEAVGQVPLSHPQMEQNPASALELPLLCGG